MFIALKDIQHPAANLYSDLFKDAYGHRPRANIFFESEAHFEKELTQIEELISYNIEMERFAAELNKDTFITCLRDTGATTFEEALEILIADSKGIDIEDVKHYGHEYAEFHFGLAYGDIASITMNW